MKPSSELPFSAFAACIVLLLLSVGFSPGCAKKVPPPTVADIRFPVLVLYPNSFTVMFKDAADLGTMNTGVVIALSQSPLLIDSDFNIFTMEHLKSTHGGLWLMAHPVGMTEVEFTLARAPKTGLDAARAAMRVQLDMQTSRDDLDQKRAFLARQTTLDGLLKALPGEGQ